MDELLVNPMFQAGAAPFLATLVLAAILCALRFPAWGVSVAVGFLITVYLVVGYQFVPLTSQRKIVILGIGAALIGLLLDFCVRCRRRLFPILPLAAIAGTLWLIWPVLMRKEGNELWLLAIVCVVYIAWVVVLFEGMRGQAWRAATGVFVLAMGTGLSVLLAASALLSQLGLAIGAGAGAVLLVALGGSAVAAGSAFTLFASLVVGLVAIGGYVYAQLPVYIFLPLALIPLLAHIPVPAWKRWKQTALLLLIMGPFALLAVYLTWRETGAPPI